MLYQIQEPTTYRDISSESEEIAIGIDLGTTFSLAAVSYQQLPQILTPEAIPSVVSYANSKIVVGKSALPDFESHSETVITSVKRLMGRGRSDVLSATEQKLYGIKPSLDEGGPIQIHIAEKVVTPLEVSAEILKAIKMQAEASLQKPVHKAVITVPAYFDDTARQATKDAARLAGLEVLRLVNEPTAAALAYGLDAGIEGLYAVYDLGGGTFDFSLLRLHQGVFQVLATAGDTCLGGDDFDEVLLNAVTETYQLELDTQNYKKAMQQVRKLKETLSECDAGQLVLEDRTISLSRTQLDNLVAPLIAKTLAICNQALADAKVNKNELKGVILAGGSTRTPIVQKSVCDFFQQEPLCSMNPDQVVALGAALQAEALTRESGNLLLDVIPLSLGVEMMGGVVERIIERNSPLPASQAKLFTTYQDGQTGLQLHVVQGDREMAADCRSLAKFELTGIPSMAAGAARIEVKFMVDTDGLLTVIAKELTTGINQGVEVKPSYGLSAADIDNMLRESFHHATNDLAQRRLVEARISGNNFLKHLVKLLIENQDVTVAEELQEIHVQIEALEKELRQQDHGAIEEAIDMLKKLAEPLIERYLNQSVQHLLNGQKVSAIAESLQEQ